MFRYLHNTRCLLKKKKKTGLRLLVFVTMKKKTPQKHSSTVLMQKVYQILFLISSFLQTNQHSAYRQPICINIFIEITTEATDIYYRPLEKRPQIDREDGKQSIFSTHMMTNWSNWCASFGSFGGF